MFRVYQDNIPADCFGYPEISKDWNNSKFETFSEAITYAILWAYPYTLSDITSSTLIYFEEMFKENGYSLDMSMNSNFPVIMSIKEE